MTKHITRMEIDDAEHYTPEQRQAIIDAYPEHEREARTKGIPSLGSGRVFPISEDAILCDPIPIPKHWFQIIGMDFGWEHPFAATRNAWDKDNDVWYVVASYREAKATPPIHVAAIKPGATGSPVHGRMTACSTTRAQVTSWRASTASLGSRCSTSTPHTRLAAWGLRPGSPKYWSACRRALQGLSWARALDGGVSLLPPRGRPHRQGARRPDLINALRDHDAPFREATAIR